MKRAIFLSKTFQILSRRDSCNLQEIPPCSGALTIAYIVEKFLDIGIQIFFQLVADIVDTAFGEICNEGHSGFPLEGFAHVCTVGPQPFRQSAQAQVRVPPLVIVVQQQDNPSPKTTVSNITSASLFRLQNFLRTQQAFLQLIPGNRQEQGNPYHLMDKYKHIGVRHLYAEMNEPNQTETGGVKPNELLVGRALAPVVRHKKQRKAIEQHHHEGKQT